MLQLEKELGLERERRRQRTGAVAVRLLLPLALSAAPWILAILIADYAPADLEGDYYLSTSVGFLAFYLTGPWTGLALGRFVRAGTLTFWGFAGLMFMVALPVLSFEGFDFHVFVLDVIRAWRSVVQRCYDLVLCAGDCDRRWYLLLLFSTFLLVVQTHRRASLGPSRPSA
jgi:hypothetical protein